MQPLAAHDAVEGVGLVAIRRCQVERTGNLLPARIPLLQQANELVGLHQLAVWIFYQQLAKVATQPGLIREANQRLAFVTSDSGKSFYSWFSQLDPKPDAPITLPSDMLLPPTTPDLQFGPSDTELNSSLLPTATPPAGTADEDNIPLDTSSAPDLPAALSKRLTCQ